MTIKSGVRASLVMVGLFSTSLVHPAAGLMVTGLPATGACVAPGGQTWRFEANWNALMVDGKPWPKYIIAAAGCVHDTPVTCSAAKCSYRVICPGKAVKTAAHVLPTGVVNAAGKGIRTSSTVVDSTFKPTTVCKTP